MSDIVYLRAEHRWTCPNCIAEDVTHHSAPHTRFHICSGLKGIQAPMVPAGTRCKVVAVPRGDYVGGELVQLDGEGTPVMSVVTVRDDGMDCSVLAPTAQARREDAL